MLYYHKSVPNECFKLNGLSRGPCYKNNFPYNDEMAVTTEKSLRAKKKCKFVHICARVFS